MIKNRKKIAIAKIGQKIIFNRNDTLVKRDNSNGNYELYQMLRLLFDNTQDVDFYIISDNDIATTNIYNHVKDSYGDKPKKYDATIVIAGLGDYENNLYSDTLFNTINLSDKLLLISTDPRCLESTLIDKRLTKQPNKILSQFEGTVNYDGIIYNIDYAPLETSTAYEHKLDASLDNYFNKTKKLVVISNSSAKEYGRIEKVSKLLDSFKDVEVYGKIIPEEVKLLNKQHYMGSVKYNIIPKILKASDTTLIVPIDKNVVTGKYIEALMYNCIPIFYKDYNIKDINKPNEHISKLLQDLVVENSEELIDKVSQLTNDVMSLVRIHMTLYYALVAPYVDGKKLSREIMRRVI